VFFEKRGWTGPTRGREGKLREEERKSSVQINAEWADMIIKKHFLKVQKYQYIMYIYNL